MAESQCIVSNMISSEHAEGELGDMEIGGNRSCSSSSTSSFDSCSDLLGSMDMSARLLARAKERQQEDNTIFERFPVKEGYGGSADAKHLNVPRNGYGSFVQDQNGGLVERLIKQAGSLRKKINKGEEANLSVEPHSLEQQETEPIAANMQKPIGNSAFKKGAQMSSLTRSSPSGFNLASSSLVLPEEDAICSFRSEHDVDSCNDNEHFHSDASDLLANSATDIYITGTKNINNEVSPFNYVNQTHNHNSNFGTKIKSRPEADYDLQQLENSIKFFDLYKTNTSYPHPLGSMSSRRSSPDLKVLERIDSVEVAGKKQSHVRSLSSGMIRKDQKFALAPHKKLKSASMHSLLDYEESGWVHPRLKGKKDEFQYEAKNKRSTTVHYDNQGRKTASNDTLSELEATLTQTLDIKQRSGQPMFNEELPGEIQQNRS